MAAVKFFISSSDLTKIGEFRLAVQLPRFFVLTEAPPCTDTTDMSISNFIMEWPLNGVFPDGNEKFPYVAGSFTFMKNVRKSIAKSANVVKIRYN